MSFLKLSGQTGSLELSGEARDGYSDYLLLSPETSLNQSATKNYNVNYNICAKSGFKAKPWEMVKDPYSGDFVLKEYADNQPIPRFKSRPDRYEGPMRPEPQSPTFIGGAECYIELAGQDGFLMLAGDGFALLSPKCIADRVLPEDL